MRQIKGRAQFFEDLDFPDLTRKIKQAWHLDSSQQRPVKRVFPVLLSESARVEFEGTIDRLCRERNGVHQQAIISSIHYSFFFLINW